MKSWKTTMAGVATLLTGLADILMGLANGTPINWAVDIVALTTGIGLILGKDFNVSGVGK